jgi:ATP-dependent DNA helicase DinG
LATKEEIIFDLFENKIPAYYGVTTVREEQVQMAFEIAHFLQEGNKRILFVEAPVGTGKSLGVLVPSMVDIKNDVFNTSKRVMYATSTVSLQGQLMSSEIPLLQSVNMINKPLLAKGKTHYYCHVRLSKLADNEKFSPIVNKLQEFFTTSTTGQRSELEEVYELDMEDSDWRKVEFIASPSECEGCQFSLICPTRLHRKMFRSQLNDVTVTNHDQLIVSFLGGMEGGFGHKLLDIDPGVVVIDEAHHFLENFLGRIEENKNLSNIKGMRKHIRKKEDKNIWDAHIKTIEIWIETIKKDKLDSETGRCPLAIPIQGSLRKIKELIDDSMFGASYAAEDALDDVSRFLDKLIKRNIYVGWFDYDGDKFCLVPSDFKEKFNELIYTMKKYNKVIFMSGTLTVNGDFSSILSNWGLDKSNVLTAVFESPFDYRNQALVYIPDGLVKPDHKQFITSANKEIQRLIELTGGRTLLLNTSKEHMNSFYHGIKSNLNGTGVPIYIQGMMGVDKLTKRFKEDESSVLVGSGSFFSGFSVSGMALTSVILNRLPFPVKDDPIYELLSEGMTDKESFDYITFPTMVNKLDQAAGRLIRSIEDFGIFTLLDTRVFQAGYGENVKDLLEAQGYIITRSWVDVARFYQRKLEKGAEAHYKPYTREAIRVHPSLNKNLKEKRTDVEVGKVKVVKEKNNGLTKKQREFIKEFCCKEGIKVTSKKYAEVVYNEMFQELYYSWKDTQYFQDHFPYRDEKEREMLSNIVGKKRRTFMPKCTRFGCNGSCTEEEHKKVEEHLYKTYGVTVDGYIKNKGFSLITVNPISILETDEFKPDELQLGLIF